jgi:3-phosphoshikimate 1-carboxyvinyltransferase
MSEIIIKPFKNGRDTGLNGEIACPSDKSVTHRSIIFAAVATGKCTIENPLLGADCLSTMQVFRDLGVSIELDESQSPPVVNIDSPGWKAWKSPQNKLDFGNSGTTARLLTGVFAAVEGLVVTASGDESLNSRPMSRVVTPLRKMGADISGAEGGKYLPLTITGRPLEAMEHVIDKASAQVKSCLLLAGLFSEGEMLVGLPAGSRDHTEIMLRKLGAPLVSSYGDGREEVRLKGPWEVPLRSYNVPGDPSSAAFWGVLAGISKKPNLTITRVMKNRTRTGFLDALKRFGVEFHTKDKKIKNSCEPVTDIIFTGSCLNGIVITPEEIPTLIDEVPVLAVLAAFAEGPSRFCGLGELRVKESDRLEATYQLLQSMGSECFVDGDDLVIRGGLQQCKAFVCNPLHDHRIAMAAAIGAKFSDGPCEIKQQQCVAVSYPEFFQELSKF